MSVVENQPSVAVVILNWNGQHFLEQYLPSVIQSEYKSFKIYVADNASTDNSIEFLKNRFPKVESIPLDKNYGFAGGYNRALKNLKEDYFVLLNSDVKVTRGWILPVIELMENDKTIAACQPKILSLKNPEYFEYAGACGGWIDKLGYPFCRGRVFEFCEKDNGQYDSCTQIFWATGAALFIRSECYEEAGGLDEYFFAHQEEIDLCWRLQNAGYKIYVQPKSLVYHLGGGSLKQGSSQKVFLNFRNNLIMMHKNLNPGDRWIKIAIRLFLDGLAGAQYILKGKLTLMFAVLRAHGAYYKWSWKSDKIKTTRKSLNQMQGVLNKSLVISYFLKHKKTFSEIVDNKI